MRKKHLLAGLGVLGLTCVSAQALAVTIPIGNVTLQTGANSNAASDHFVYQSDGLGTLTNIGQQPPPYGAPSYLAGNPAAPGSNIELSTLDDPATEFGPWAGGAPPTILSGDFAGSNSIMLASPTYADWTDDSNALAKEYITDALASIGKTPSDLIITLDMAAAGFVGDPSGAFRVSDPNIAYVNLIGGLVEIGLQGLLDASPIIDPLLFLVGLTPADVPSPQASEVVKYTYGGKTGFLYSFRATPTNQAAGCSPTDPTCSYTGDYRVTIPEPTSSVLLGLGLAGLGLRRRRLV